MTNKGGGPDVPSQVVGANLIWRVLNPQQRRPDVRKTDSFPLLPPPVKRGAPQKPQGVSQKLYILEIPS